MNISKEAMRKLLEDCWDACDESYLSMPFNVPDRDTYITSQLSAMSEDDGQEGKGLRWVKASERLPKIEGKKCKPVFVNAEIGKYGGGTYVSKRVAYYFPEHFKNIEWEDWDDYSEENFPYTEDDKERECVWLRPGWYESVNCDNCEWYWSSPINVIEWLDKGPLPVADGEGEKVTMKELVKQIFGEEAAEDKDIVDFYERVHQTAIEEMKLLPSAVTGGVKDEIEKAFRDGWKAANEPQARKFKWDDKVLEDDWEEYSKGYSPSPTPAPQEGEDEK